MSTGDSEFILKHRIVGAAFLIFFAALIVPWVLGPPSAATKPGSVLVVPIGDSAAADAEREVLAQLQEAMPAQTDKVYISKITPLKQNSSAGGSTNANTATAVPKKVDQPVVTKVKPERVVPVPVATAQDSPAKPAPSQSAPSQATIEVGWAVQVGIYTSNAGVEKVVRDLRANGFNPTTTVVDTNKGVGTGTRVWLGPFAQRVEAAKAKSQLTEKTGEAGFIRAYP